MNRPLRVPPYTGWAEQQAPQVMAARQRQAADTMSGLALLQVVAARQQLAAATERYDRTQWGQLRTGVRQWVNQHTNPNN